MSRMKTIKASIVFISLIIIIIFYGRCGKVIAFDSVNSINISNTGESYIFITKFGKKGNGNEQFNSPWGIAVDKDDFVYVSDTGNKSIKKFDSNGNFIKKWNGIPFPYSHSVRPFVYPLGISSDPDGNIWVVDHGSINKLDSRGQFATIQYFEWPQSGVINVITPDSKGDLFLTDNSGHIRKFNSDGKLLKDFDFFYNDDDLSITSITGIAVNSYGDVYAICRLGHPVMGNGFFIVDEQGHNTYYYNYYILQFDSSGKLTGKIETTYEKEWQLDKPAGLTIDSNYNLYVADYGNNRIQQFYFPPTNSDNKSVKKFVATWGVKGEGDGQFNGPSGVALDSHGNIYVVDSGNNRIQKFSHINKDN